MHFLPIKTRAFLPPKDDLYAMLDSSLPKLQNGDVLLITSKVLAIHQGRCVMIDPTINKDALIAAEADAIIPRHRVPEKAAILTLKGSTLIPSSGIDESNGNGYYILWPKNVNPLLKEIRARLLAKHKLTRLGLIATDSHTIPLRYGVLGISIGFFGLEPLFDYRGTKDIFGRKLVMTRANVPDALAAMGVLLMGEAAERCPFLLIRGANFVRFANRSTWHKLAIPPDVDLYAPLLKVFKKKKR